MALCVVMRYKQPPFRLCPPAVPPSLAGHQEARNLEDIHIFSPQTWRFQSRLPLKHRLSSNTVYNLSLVQNPFLSTSKRPGIFLSKAEGVSSHSPFWANPFNHRHFRTYCFCWLEQPPSIWLSAPAFHGCLCQPLRIQLRRSGCSLGKSCNLSGLFRWLM